MGRDARTPTGCRVILNGRQGKKNVHEELTVYLMRHTPVSLRGDGEFTCKEGGNLWVRYTTSTNKLEIRIGDTYTRPEVVKRTITITDKPVTFTVHREPRNLKITVEVKLIY